MYEFTDGALHEIDEEEREGFKIDSDGLSEWALKKIRRNNEEVERLTRLANEEIEAIQDALTTATSSLNHSTEFLSGHLRAYFNTVKHKETATQESYKLLSGSLVMKKASQKVIKTDDAELIKYLKASGQKEFIKTKEEPAWGDFKKNLVINEDSVVDMATGEVIDCVKVEDVPEEFKVKF